MRNTRAIYQKLREVKYLHLTKLYKKYLKKTPENCTYNRSYKFMSDGSEHEIRLCMLHQPELKIEAGVYPHLIDVCQELNHCINCNAFVLKYSKEDIKKLLEEEYNDKKLKERKYPDVCALEWVLEQSVIGTPPFTTLQKIYYTVKRFLFNNKII